MSSPLNLLVPAPAVSFKAVAGTYAPLTDVVTLSFDAVRFPDGSAMSSDDLAAAQALLLRNATPISSTEVWDADAKSWRSVGGADLRLLNGIPLLPPKSGAAPWQGVLLAAAVTDAGGTPQIAAAAPNFPQYRVRGAFRAKRAGVEAFGLGPESAPIEFAAASATGRFGAELTPDPAGATRVRIVLRSASAQPIGFVEIDASDGNRVTLANFDAFGSALASVVLQADGSIRLAPLAGRTVVIAGDLEAEHVRYLPAGGGAKQDLT